MTSTPDHTGQSPRGTIDLSIGAYPYDQLAALASGEVGVEGVASTRFESARVVTDVFERMVVDHAYDVAELGWTYFLRTMELEDPPFVAIPVFPNRQFRHSAVYVNTATGIDTPEQLAGRTIGEFALYGHDAGFWPKGILRDEHGLEPRDSRWVIGGLDWPMRPVDYVAQHHPDDVDVTWLPDGTDLGDLLERGEIDALISADVPRCVLEGSPAVRRLFPDAQAVERDYFRRTGIFPIMHTVVLPRQLVRHHPWLPRAVFEAFCASKATAQDGYRFRRIFNNMDLMIPWVSQLIDENAALFADDPWPYGISANRSAVEAVLRYHHEQGLTRRHFRVEDVFVDDLLHT